MTLYLTIDDALHVLDRFGFHARDVGLLASALARPATTISGVDAYDGIAMKSAALLESVVRNHPLLDGNKRTGWTLVVLFLWINGYSHTMDADTGFDLVTGVARGEFELESVAAVIRSNLSAR